MDEDGSRIRKDESYEKNYLIGKYEAIPTLKSIDIFKGAGCPGDIGLAPTGVERREWVWRKRTERCFFTGLHQALAEDVRNKLVIKETDEKKQIKGIR